MPRSLSRPLLAPVARRLAIRRPRLETLEGRQMLSAAPMDAASQAGEAAIAKSIDAFGTDLYEQLQSETGGNLVMSPFSAATALAMTYAGAQGQTAQQMANALHLNADPATVESEFGSLLSDLNAAGQSGGYLLSAANALWVQQGLDLLPEFIHVMQSEFNGALNQADFIDAAETARH